MGYDWFLAPTISKTTPPTNTSPCEYCEPHYQSNDGQQDETWRLPLAARAMPQSECVGAAPTSRTPAIRSIRVGDKTKPSGYVRAAPILYLAAVSRRDAGHLFPVRE